MALLVDTIIAHSWHLRGSNQYKYSCSGDAHMQHCPCASPCVTRTDSAGGIPHVLVQGTEHSVPLENTLSPARLDLGP